jgi:uncharacterized protein HemX
MGTSYLSYFLWQRSSQLQRQTYQQINPLMTQVATLEQQIKTFQSQYEQKLEQSLQTMDHQVKLLVQQQQRLQDNLAVLTHQVQQPQDNTEWIIAEIAYLLNIANQRLLLMKDIEGALTAVTAADKRLNTLNHPALYELKTQLTKEIEQLKNVKRPAIEISAKRLTEYMLQVEQLPLAQEHSIHSITQEELNSAGTALWREISRLITIRYRVDTKGEFLTEEHRYFVIQTLRLKLEIARSFLLLQDFANLMMALESVQAWLDRYYDQNNEKVKNLIHDLKEMRIESVSLPDLSLSLKALQNLTATTLLPKAGETQ